VKRLALGLICLPGYYFSGDRNFLEMRLEAPPALVLSPEVIELPSQVLDGPCDILDIIMGD
jgi:hypothetical protein